LGLKEALRLVKGEVESDEGANGSDRATEEEELWRRAGEGEKDPDDEVRLADGRGVAKEDDEAAIALRRLAAERVRGVDVGGDSLPRIKPPRTPPNASLTLLCIPGAGGGSPPARSVGSVETMIFDVS
jgi:hypothetical protein